MLVNRHLIGVFFVIIASLLSGCRNHKMPFHGTLLFADRDSLLKVDLHTKKQDILLKTSEQFWLSNPTYNGNDQLIAIEECNAIDQRCRIALLNRMGGKIGICLSDINPNAFPSWSPDGQLLALQVQSPSANIEKTVYRVTIYTRQGVKVGAIGKDSGGGQISWAPDGKYIAYSSMEDEIIIADLTTRESFSIGKGVSPIFSPKNDSVAFITDGEIRSFDLQKRITLTLAKGSLLSHFSAINGWSNKKNCILLSNSAPSFFHEKYFASIYDLENHKNSKILNLPALLPFEWIED